MWEFGMPTVEASTAADRVRLLAKSLDRSVSKIVTADILAVEPGGDLISRDCDLFIQETVRGVVNMAKQLVRMMTKPATRERTERAIAAVETRFPPVTKWLPRLLTADLFRQALVQPGDDGDEEQQAGRPTSWPKSLGNSVGWLVTTLQLAQNDSQSWANYVKTGGHLSSKRLVNTTLSGNDVDYRGATQILKIRVNGFITTAMLKHSSSGAQAPKKGWGNCPTCGIGTEDSVAHFLTKCRQFAKDRRDLLHPEILVAEVSKALKAAVARRSTVLAGADGVFSKIESDRGVSLAHLGMCPISGGPTGDQEIADELV